MHLWDDPPLVVGHRGSPSEAPENTVRSFQMALAAGARAVELDVCLSRDGEIMVHHDPVLGRTFPGTEALDAVDASHLRALGVPTLREVLTAVPTALVDVELKTEGERAGELPLRVARLVRELGALERVLVTSFDPELANAYGEQAARPVGAIVPFPVEADEFAALRHVRHVMMAHEAISPELVAAHARAGKTIQAWTVNDEREAQRLVKMGVRSVITDRPGPLAHALRR